MSISSAAMILVTEILVTEILVVISEGAASDAHDWLTIPARKTATEGLRQALHWVLRHERLTSRNDLEPFPSCVIPLMSVHYSKMCFE